MSKPPSPFASLPCYGTKLGLEDEHFDTARELWDALDTTAAPWVEASQSRCEWLFRGHADLRWKLQPPTFRDSGREWVLLREVIDRVMREEERAPNLAAQGMRGMWTLREYAQCRLVREFAELADSQGHSLPGIGDGVSFGRITPGPNHPLTALAQHHRVPTCLLDFTRDPLVAMHWATETAPEDAKSLAIWALDPRRIAGRVEVLRYVRSTNRNLHAQDGVLLHFHCANDEFLASRPLPTLDTCDAVYQGGLRCMVLPRSQVRELRRLLELRGMHRARLLPDLNGVAETIVARYSQ